MQDVSQANKDDIAHCAGGDGGQSGRPDSDTEVGGKNGVIYRDQYIANSQSVVWFEGSEEVERGSVEVGIGNVPYHGKKYLQRLPPSIYTAKKALVDIRLLLKPPRTKGGGYKDPDLDTFLCNRLEMMCLFLVAYTDPIHSHPWIAASLTAACGMQKGHYSRTYSAEQLRK